MIWPTTILLRESVPEFFDDGHFLKRQRALEKLAAVQAGAQNEMAVEQRARLAKKREQILAH